jgi:nucleotide-binding universal stress UspA family protein
MSSDVLVLVGEGDRTSPHVARAIELAAEREATLHALYVIDAWRFGEYSVYGWDEFAREVHEEAGEKELDAIARQCADRGVDFDPVTARGKPVSKTISEAAANDVSVIVAGRPNGSGDHVLSENMVDRLRADAPMTVEVVSASR